MSTTPALNPTIKALLTSLASDRAFVRGNGTRLFDAAGREYLDCWAQYGVLALGHNPPAVVAAVSEALGAGTPAFLQPYRAPHAEALAEELVRRAPPGLTRCLFTSSGAEAVEAAIKLTRAATGRTRVLSTDGAYHGSTYGAMAASGQREYRQGFGPLPAGFDTVPYGDADALDARLAQDGTDVAAFIVEPIQGRRGAHAPPAGYLARAREACTRYGVALVADEIQTGLWRTGTLFACEREAVAPDVLLVAKALGGGLFRSARAWRRTGCGATTSRCATCRPSPTTTLRASQASSRCARWTDSSRRFQPKRCVCGGRSSIWLRATRRWSARSERTGSSPRSSSTHRCPRRGRASPRSKNGASSPRPSPRRSPSGSPCWCCLPSVRRTSCASSPRS